MTTYSDDFGRANGQLNGSEATIADVGQGWTWSNTNAANLLIQGNALVHTLNGSTLTYFTPSFSLATQNYRVALRHVQRGDRNGAHSIYLRWDNATNSGYRVYFHPFARIYIYRSDDGDETEIASITGLGWSDNHIASVEIVGSLIKASIDGVEKLSVTDSDYTSGIMKLSCVDGGNTTSTYLTFDDFSLEELFVTYPPKAQFRTKRDNLAVLLDASFSSDPDGNVASYEVDWGDGTDADSGASPDFSHVYASAGTYSITLTVTDDDDETATMTQILTVLEDQDAVASVVPGVTAPSSWSAIAQPAGVGEGDFDDAKAMGSLDIDLDLLYSSLESDRRIYIAASHAMEIDRVELFANNGTAAVAIQKVKVPSEKLVNGRTAFPFDLTTANFPSGYFELRAVAYPKIGIPRVLQVSTKTYYHDGSFYFNGGSKVVKYLDKTVVSSGDGSSGSPYKSINDVIVAKKASSTTRAQVWDLRIRNATIPWSGDWVDVTTGAWTGTCHLSADTNYVPIVTIEFDGTLNNDANGYIRQRDALFTFMPTTKFDLGKDESVTTATNLQGALPVLYGGLHIFFGGEIFSTISLGSVGVAVIPVPNGATEIEVYDAQYLPESGTLPIFDATYERETISYTGKSGNTLTGVTGVIQEHTDQITIGRIYINRRLVANSAWQCLCDGVTYHNLPWKFPQTQYLRNCVVHTIGADFVFRLGACLDTQSYDIWPDGHGDFAQVYSSVDPEAAPFENSYLDGAYGQLFLFEMGCQAGLYADHFAGYRSIALRRMLIEGNHDRLVQLAFGCDGTGKSFEHLLVDRVTIPGANLRLSDGQQCAFKNIMIARTISRDVTFQQNTTYTNAQVRSFCYDTDLAGVTPQYAFDGVQANEDDVFKHLDYDPLNPNLIDLTPRGAAITAGANFKTEWQEYDVFGNPFKDEAGAIAVRSSVVGGSIGDRGLGIHQLGIFGI